MPPSCRSARRAAACCFLTRRASHAELPRCTPTQPLQVCTDGGSFVVINQKGIDPGSLDMLAKEGILALR